MQLSSLKMVRLLGDKSVSSVHLAEYHGKAVAVKKLMGGARVGSSLPLSHPELAQLRNEIYVNAAVSHRNCVRLYGVCPEPAALITEYCEQGSIADVLKKAKAQPDVAKQLSWPRRLSMAIDAAKGLHALHARPAAHPAPKPHLKQPAGDPGLARQGGRLQPEPCPGRRAGQHHRGPGPLLAVCPSTHRWMYPRHPHACTPATHAPEVIGGEAPTKEADIYSYGIVMWELLTWDIPWGRKPWQVVPLVVNGGRPEVPPHHRLPGWDTVPPAVLEGYTALMRRVWAQSPFDRPTLGEVVTELGQVLEQALCEDGRQGSAAPYDPYVSATFGARVRPREAQA
ncbi:hypothetical protein ABPG75_013667 [Micractinium tetrahymenae]